MTKKYKITCEYEVLVDETEIHALTHAFQKLPNAQFAILQADVKVEKVTSPNMPPPGKYTPPAQESPTPQVRTIAPSIADPDSGIHKEEVDSLIVEIASDMTLNEHAIRSMARSIAKRDSTTLVSALRRMRMKALPQEITIPSQPKESIMTFSGAYESGTPCEPAATLVTDMQISRYSRDYRQIYMLDGSQRDVIHGAVTYNGHTYNFLSKDMTHDMA